MIAKLLAWIDRQGGMLVAPRRTLASLDADAGARDGTWALIAYLLAAHVDDVIVAIARLVAVRDIGGIADVAIGLVAPFLALSAIEILLGRRRAHRAPLFLAPMIAAAAVLHLLQGLRVVVWSAAWMPAAVCAAIAIAFALALRGAIPMREEVQPS